MLGSAIRFPNKSFGAKVLFEVTTSAIPLPREGVAVFRIGAEGLAAVSVHRTSIQEVGTFPLCNTLFSVTSFMTIIEFLRHTSFFAHHNCVHSNQRKPQQK